MPSNRELQQECLCWREVAEEVGKIVRTGRPKDFDELVLSCIKQFEVREKRVRQHIMTFYVNKGSLVLDDGFLHPGGRE